VFDSVSQVCTLIDVYDVSRPLLEMSYMGSTIKKGMRRAAAAAAAVMTAREQGDISSSPPSSTPSVSSAPLPRLSHLSPLFGPTFPGSFDASTRTYLLQYPGLALLFHADRSETDEHGAERPSMDDGSSPILQRLFIHVGRDVAKHHDRGMEVLDQLLASAGEAPSYFEPITVRANEGIRMERRGINIGFGTHAQDLLSLLGSPENVYLKSRGQDKMRIHNVAPSRSAAGSGSGSNTGAGPATSSAVASHHSSPRSSGGMTASASTSRTHSPAASPQLLSTTPPSIASSIMNLTAPSPSPPPVPVAASSSSHPPPPPTSDYFFNYFQHGFDLLLDGVNHRVKKIILHNNEANRPDFGRYNRCNWRVEGSLSGAGLDGVQAVSRAMDNLELPPTAAQMSHTGSMLHAGLTSRSGAPDTEESEARSSSPPRTVTVPLPQNGGGGGGGGKKKKGKKGKSATTSTAESSSTAPNDDNDNDGDTSSAVPPVDVSSAITPMMTATNASVTSGSPQSTVITPDSKWRDIVRVLGPSVGRPMVCRGVVGGGNGNGSISGSRISINTSIGSAVAIGSRGGASSTPPAAPSANSGNSHGVFGATYFYAYDGLIFEVMSNQRISTVTLFREEE